MNVVRTILVGLVLSLPVSVAATLCPDGNYHPDYGSGVRLAPDRHYVPNVGSIVLCPDGNYYPGSSCRMLPDGSYIGVR